MIGVIADAAEQEVVREFFELFKTPWEFYRRGGQYDVLLCAGGQFSDSSAKLVLVYGGEEKPFDREHGLEIGSRLSHTVLAWQGRRLPIYGNCVTFNTRAGCGFTGGDNNQAAAVIVRSGAQTVVRVGLDLFQEVRHLLTCGQPPVHAGIPTLELQIDVVRDMMARAGISFVEIPPVPEGYNFMVCLTHDIDHPAVRNHWCDHTMLGFLYRATIGTLVNVCRGRKSARDLVINWTAALKLPWVYLGLAKDFWRGFDRYLEMETGLGSTFFVIPRKGYAGRSAGGPAAAKRAAGYDLADIQGPLRQIISAGGEVGLHGIDAWCDSTEGRNERGRVTQALGAAPTGVRMHWLFFDDRSPAVLDQAGFDYDSTVGYRETVGYRAGTTQAYKPLDAVNLLELPLHVMDTALFYPGYLNLSERKAERTVGELIAGVAEFGGAFTINWHDRSIAPERLWDDFYLGLLRELKRRGAWFPTAAQAVSWFRNRRSAVLEVMPEKNGQAQVRARVNADDRLPGFRVRVHTPGGRTLSEPGSPRRAAEFREVAFKREVDMSLAM